MTIETTQTLASTAILARSKLQITLSGSETEEEARAAEKQPIANWAPFRSVSFYEERVHRKRVLTAGFRLFAKFGFDEGVAGHMTCRDPEFPDLFWVNPFAMYFGHIKSSDLVLVDHVGEVVRGTLSVNKAAFAIHSQVHEARPDAICACHSHSMYGKAFSVLGRPLLPITQDACAFYETHTVFDDYAGVVFSTEEGARIAKSLGSTNKALILRNHGLLTVGESVESAIWWFISMERCAQAQLLAEQAAINGWKDLLLVDPDMAAATHGIIGTELAGQFSFRPMYDMITKEQPDCLE